uniref:CCHC-type domain-containing protein n=1 Tax=Populus alba TaxID=43335 RepID=A0A4U5NK45_POPAL|nr:hypothetical protein D5086_0000265600 [Populus alba]
MTTQIDSATTFSSSTPPHQEVSLITINTTAQTPLKLTSTNYLSWKLQFETLFIGYDLIGYIDGSTPCPPNTIIIDTVTMPNPSHKLWIRQDKLLLNALIGSISPTIIPFIACAKTAQEAWNILASTYAKPSRGRIKQVKHQLKHPSKGSRSVTEFLHSVKASADELAILGAPMDPEDITDTILDGLDDDYKELVRAVQARDTSISFDELHEKLLSFEAISLSHATPLPITANPIQRTFTPWRGSRPPFPFRPSSSSPSNSQYWRSSPASTFRPHFNSNTRPAYRPTRPPQRPYQGFCQICGIQGHTAKRCPSFQLIPTNATNIDPSTAHNSSSSWQPPVSWLPPVLTVSVPLPSQLPSYTPAVPAPELPPAAASSLTTSSSLGIRKDARPARRPKKEKSGFLQCGGTNLSGLQSRDCKRNCFCKLAITLPVLPSFGSASSRILPLYHKRMGRHVVTRALHRSRPSNR